MPGKQTPNTKSAPRFLTIKQVTEYVNVSRGVVEGWLNRGLLPFYELPGSGHGSYRFRRIAEEDLKVFIQKYYSGWEESKNRAPKRGKKKLLSRDGNVER